MLSSFLIEKIGLCGDPFVELPNRFSFRRKLYVGVDGMNVSAAGMAHQRFADFLHHSRLHESAIEAVTQIVEAVIANARANDRGLPGGLDGPNGPVVIREEESAGVRVCGEQVEEPPRERNFPSFPARRLGTGYQEQTAGEINVLPFLG